MAFVRILLNVNLSLNQTLLIFWLYVRQTWVTQLILEISLWQVIFHFPIIEKDYLTHTHGLAVYVMEKLSFPQDVYVENSTTSYLCFRLALLHSVYYFLFLYQSLSSSLCMVFYSISSNIDEVPLINLSLMCLPLKI